MSTVVTTAPPVQTMSLQAVSHSGSSDEELLQLFRRVTISSSDGHDVSEIQIKKAFQQEISRPLGRQMLEASLAHANGCSCYHWNYHDRISGKVNISRVDLTFDLTSKSMGQAVKGEAAGFYRPNSAFINATVYYDDQQYLQGNQSVQIYMDGSKFIIDFFTTDQSDKPVARIVQNASSFTFQGTDTGDATWGTS
ncbi:hypothetical protein AnigIFM63309_006761 [Aspergillus niger]|uniref:Uncharacterized protein n=1 Tax=Aspergillus welwitschiae TaxID=1341132 RepID=A0A3F3QKI0_9EURO|nr:hypothetical protein BDQ94DRAFT_8439 [Aspergillus welwitschiae]RDH39758.1 hypothetical protein BDQ94DRAFT_8439 [Aspergillus welwitschiae]GLA39422.1 hypothetical protein AnigIFM63309_006761 [Aspergillus niger]